VSHPTPTSLYRGQSFSEGRRAELSQIEDFLENRRRLIEDPNVWFVIPSRHRLVKSVSPTPPEGGPFIVAKLRDWAWGSAFD